MRPTVGRSVHFLHNGEIIPAIVQGIQPDGHLRLFVMTRFSGEIRHDVTEGPHDGQWHWPEIVR